MSKPKSVVIVGECILKYSLVPQCTAKPSAQARVLVESQALLDWPRQDFESLWSRRTITQAAAAV